VNNRGWRTFLAIATGVAVIYFGSRPGEGGGVTNAIVVLAIVAAVTVWFLTKPGKTDKPVS
jgi:drug/metabolite transporter (DMT)-like permease